MKKIIVFSLFMVSALVAGARGTPRAYFELKIYRYATAAQEAQIDQFLKQAYIPAMHRLGIPSIGVFKPIAGDTVNNKRIYVLATFWSLADFERINEKLLTDTEYREKGRFFLEAPYNDSPFLRVETIVMKSFKGMPRLEKPSLTAERAKRIYELRSYEGATESLYRWKVHMFNEGNEIALFERLQFHAVFYGDVLSGSHQPNLMYMTSFESREERDKHWAQFVDSPEWKRLVVMPEYQHTVSKLDMFLLYPTEYSDY